MGLASAVNYFLKENTSKNLYHYLVLQEMCMKIEGWHQAVIQYMDFLSYGHSWSLENFYVQKYATAYHETDSCNFFDVTL
jgi:hypothetical protein